MLVLHPNTSTLTAGAPTAIVAVLEGVSVGIKIGVLVMNGNGVLVITGMAVATLGVALLAPTTTGVGVTMEGVLVGGRKGVGGLYGEG